MAEGTIIQFLLSQVRTSETSLIGGTAYFYEVGTTTPKAVYMDMDATQAIYSIVLDADATAQIYGTGKYRVIIKDSDAVTRFDRAVNFWGGTGYVTAPATNTDNYIPQWDGVNSAILKDGLGLATTVDDPGVDTKIPTEKAVRSAISGIVGSATTAVEGVVEIATQAEALNQTDPARVITPGTLGYVIDRTPHVLQVVNATITNAAATLAISPKNPLSVLICDVVIQSSLDINVSSNATATLKKDGSTIGEATSGRGWGTGKTSIVMKHFTTSGSTTTTSYVLTFSTGMTVQSYSSITIMEVLN